MNFLNDVWNSFFEVPRKTTKKKKRGKRAAAPDTNFAEYTEAFVRDKPYEWDKKRTQQVLKNKAKIAIEKRREVHPPPKAPKISQKPVSKARKARAARQKPDARIEAPAVDDQTPDEKAVKMPPSSELNERVEEAVARADNREVATTPQNTSDLPADTDYGPPPQAAIPKSGGRENPDGCVLYRERCGTTVLGLLVLQIA